MSLTGGDRLAVGDLGQWGDDDPSPRDLGSPAEIEVFTEQGDERIEAAQRREEVRAHERDPAGRHEDVALEVLLAVVDLAAHDAFSDDAEAVTRLAHVQQDQRVLVGDELGRDDAGVGPVGRLDH